MPWPKGKPAWNKGKTKETDPRVRKYVESVKRFYETHPHPLKGKTLEEFFGEERAKEIKKKISESKRGHPVSEETRKKLSEKHKGKRLSPEHRVAISKALKGRPKGRETREKIRQAAIKQFKDPKQRELRSKLLRERLKDIAFKEEFLKRAYKALERKPTKLERRFIEIIERYELPIRYVGNGKLWIGGKNPDFIHKKINLVYEVAEPYHKRKYGGLKNYLRLRREHFGKYGYEVVLVTPEFLDMLEKKKGDLRKAPDDRWKASYKPC